MATTALAGPASVGAHAHVVVDDLASLALHDGDLHHLARVLRIRPGAAVTATDGRGSWRPASAPPGWPASGDALIPEGPVLSMQARVPRITVGLSLVKADRPEWAVQKLTELGADAVVFVAADRSVVRWDPPKVQRNLERLRVVARAALMQSRGVWLPRLDGVVTVAQVREAMPDAALAEAGGAAASLAHPTVLIGPEGGWSASELEMVTARVSLSEQVLRSETAAVACVALLAALRNRPGAPGPE